MASLPINISSVPRNPIWTKVQQSPPVDVSAPFSAAAIKNKHIVITGGASGFGAAFVRRWASLGASIVVGDVNAPKATQLIADVRATTGNANCHFIQCDVRDWHQQAALFAQAVTLSPHGAIDAVVANAGVSPPDPLVAPGLVDDAPKKPDLTCVDVNLTGLLYTAYLALFHLPKNNRPTPAQPAPDRHLLLVGSVASLCGIPGAPLYGAAKHGVLGLFRSLRASAFASGVRVNMLCPYFVRTDIVPLPARLLLAGGPWADVDGVVDAATRLAADASIGGRALCVGPRAKIRQEADGQWWLVGLGTKSEEGKAGGGGGSGSSKVGENEDAGSFETAMWDAYADDFEDSEAFTFRMVQLLNAVTAVRGWAGWASDVAGALLWPVRRLLGR